MKLSGRLPSYLFKIKMIHAQHEKLWVNINVPYSNILSLDQVVSFPNTKTIQGQWGGVV